MKAKLENILRNDVSPFFFALSCALLICISFTARALAEDVQKAVSGPSDNMMITADGQVLWTAE
jgi:hypothetical protein